VASSGLEQSLLNFINHAFNSLGWWGVVGTMTIESAAIPLPSELIMPLAGWQLVLERGSSAWMLLAAAFYGAIGNLIGSLITYYIGAWGGRPLLERYGRYVLVTRRDLDRADRWFNNRGEITVFTGRMLPVVRTFISLPAGVARMNLVRFSAFTFVGSFMWSLGLAWGGYKLGQHWEDIRSTMRHFDVPIAVVIVALIVWYIWRKLRELQRESHTAH